LAGAERGGVLKDPEWGLMGVRAVSRGSLALRWSLGVMGFTGSVR